jgi:hypothetical protein
MSDFIRSHAIAVFIFTAVLVTILGFYLGVFLIHTECTTITARLGVESRWSMMGGCEVYNNSRWIPLENWCANCVN